MSNPHLMHLVLCYDVVANARRNRLNTRLKGYLTPVQKSVFEGPLPPARLNPLLQMVADTIDAKQDVSRVYRLCPRCRLYTRHFGASTVVDLESTDVIL